MAIQEFIDKIKGIAEKVYQQTGVLPSVTIAQGIQETGGNVNNALAKGYNFFGEKGSGDIGSVRLKTQEDYGNGLVDIYDNFRVYSGEEAAATGRSKIMQQTNFQNVGKASDFDTQVSLLKAGGYATDPNYVKDLKSLYKEYNLGQYDIGSSENSGSSESSVSSGSSESSGKAQNVSWFSDWSYKAARPAIYFVIATIGIIALFLMIAPEKTMQLAGDSAKTLAKTLVKKPTKKP